MYMYQGKGTIEMQNSEKVKSLQWWAARSKIQPFMPLSHNGSAVAS